MMAIQIMEMGEVAIKCGDESINRIIKQNLKAILISHKLENNINFFLNIKKYWFLMSFLINFFANSNIKLNLIK